MNMTITFGHATVKTLTQHLHAAFRAGDLPRIKRISALLMLADHLPVATITSRLGVGRSTVMPGCRPFSWTALPVCKLANPRGVPPN